MHLLFKQKSAIFLIVLLVVMIGVIRIVSTYGIFSQTVDEPEHIACGMEWLDRGTFTLEEKIPPLGRILIALGPYLSGCHSNSLTSMWDEGRDILYKQGDYSRTLTLARAGTLPFFLLPAFIVFIWSRRLFGETAALAAIVFFTCLPPILAHSGLATTDAAVMGTLITAVFAFTIWLDKPTFTQSLLVGLTTALAVLSKTSALVFLPICFLTAMGFRYFVKDDAVAAVKYERKGMLSGFGLILLVAFFVVWAGYRFSFGSPVEGYLPPYESIDRIVGADGILHDLAYGLMDIPVPAPELVRGLEQLSSHNSGGHLGYLLGEVRQYGWWYFFPVVLAVKTPIPFIIFTLTGYAFIIRKWFKNKQRWQVLVVAACPMALLAICMQSQINIGIRHVLPVYPFFVMVAAFGALILWNVTRLRLLSRTMVSALTVWMLVSSILSHPDYLAYFNEAAGHHPEKILVDSDLDWGQDLQRLSSKLKEFHINEVSLSYFGTANIVKYYDLPTVKALVPFKAATGWVAISLTILHKLEGFSWIEKYEPFALVGRSIRLYYIPKQKDEMSEDPLSASGIKEVGRDGNYVAYANGVIWDIANGLEWIAGPDLDTTWEAASAYVTGLNIDGGGWRMPALKELKTLYNPEAGPRNMCPFLKTSGWGVWSAENDGLLSGRYFQLTFRFGYILSYFRGDSYDGRGFAVRLKKLGQGSVQ